VIVLEYVLTAMAVMLLVPCLVLLVQVLAAITMPRAIKPKLLQPADGKPVDVCLLMPAHNEASGIVSVLQALLPQLDQHTRLLVVADNCTDASAALVRELAAKAPVGKVQVVERHNTTLRGKGYALDYGVQHLKSNSPDVVLVVDADCTVLPGSIATLAQQCVASQRPAQALYLMQSPPGARVKTKLAEFAWLVKNEVRALGYYSLGLPCLLMGSGMAFTWGQISSAKLHTGHIVEDLKLGIELTKSGQAPLFCPQALVTSRFPTGAEGFDIQRTRWEHGHLAVILAELPSLIWQSITKPTIALWALVLDLCVPPLALLTLLVGGVSALSLLLAIETARWMPAVVATSAFVALAIAVLCAWFVFGRGVITFLQLCSVPMYVLRKVPLYLRFLLKRQTAWVRSKRDGE
jgi:cellulose synthase/poly-beta-1,6-N-acetylglucosamine synthase-like glycosyltransferase